MTPARFAPVSGLGPLTFVLACECNRQVTYHFARRARMSKRLIHIPYINDFICTSDCPPGGRWCCWVS